MDEPRSPREPDHEKAEAEFAQAVGEKAKRELHARRAPSESIWFGLGTFGIIGWSVAIPTLVGLGLGLWLDHQLHSRISWTLTMLFVGTLVGCLNAWFWIARERQSIEEEKEETDE
jgi:ATP synthase protein I